MNDLNFFSTYIKQKEKPNRKQTIVLSLIILGCLLFLMSPLYLNHWVSNYDENTKEANTFLSLPQTKEKIEDMHFKKQAIKELKQNEKILLELDELTKGKHIMSDKLLGNIARELPENVFLEELNIEKNSVEISAITFNKQAIAQFEYNLRNLDLYENVFISKIMEKDTDYIFNLTFNIKDVIKDED